MPVFDIEFFVTLFLCVLLLIYLGKHFFSKRKPAVKPAYMVVSGIVHDEEKAKVYQDAAIPLAKEAGLDVLASSTPLLLEGEWNNSGVVVIEKFTSMEALRNYWDSDEFQEAKKLREGVIDMHFIIAVESL